MPCGRFINWWHVWKSLLLIGALFFFCEVLFYYIVLLKCTWPIIETRTTHSTVKAMIFADTHLLGQRYGHWFDKLRREWQMYRAFQTSMSLHNPQVIFILGDIFDEGYHCGDGEFNKYVKRFHSLFSPPEKSKLYVVPGNHDMGFHYRIYHHVKERFEKSFNVSSVQMLSIHNNLFVLVNSMSMQGDGCFLCQPAEMELQRISEILNCAKSKGAGDNCKKYKNLPMYSPPIFLQHFPLFRPSDAQCSGPDAAPLEIINEPFRESWECLSKESTNKIFNLLEPRAAFSGHTHHGCFSLHREHIPEWTVSSFSWRNTNNPSFILATFAPDAYKISKCYMPKESTVISIYTIGALSIFFWMVWTRNRFFKGVMYKEILNEIKLK